MAFPSTFADLQAAVIAKTRLDPNNAADVSKTKDWINQAYYRVTLETETIQGSTTLALVSGQVTQGTATMYTLQGNSIELWPTPGGADTMTIYYVGYPPLLSAGTDVPQLDEPYASKLLEFGALIDASDYIKDILAGYTYPQSFQDWMYRYRQHLSRKQGTQSLTFRNPTGTMVPHDNSTDTGL